VYGCNPAPLDEWNKLAARAAYKYHRIMPQSSLGRSSLAFLALFAAAFSAQAVQVRFLDSATGCAIQPETVTTRAHASGAAEQRVPAGQISKSGRAALALAPGRHTVLAVSSQHRPMSAEVQAETNQSTVHQFLLDPLEEPREMQPDYLAALHRDDATLIQGFVVDDETREPLAGVRVSSAPSGVEARTDGRGFFQFYVPVQSAAEAAAAPASLAFEKPGFQSQERQYLELWPKGDWTYRIRLTAGQGREVVDERQTRHRLKPEEAPIPPQSPPVPAATPELLQSLEAATPKATAATNSTVRVPRNIRVLRSDNVTIDYVTMTYYVRCVLPSEWIPSWGATTGGSNSLNAGAIAARCYAIAKLNAVSGTSSNDICATTSCQVYNPANINSRTDTAANYTDNYVVLTSSGAVPSTEYSAEDNSLGYSCGDGWTQPTGGCTFDPVCAGQTRSGHGRGMCQWGSYRWAIGTAGYPLRDWKWIVRHYYPTYTLVKGAPLLIGDDVKAMASVNVNICPDGGITNGINCTLVATLAANTTGTIVDGPQRITADGKGFTWYKVQWNDASSTLGWAKENFIERVFSLPAAPTNLVATAIATNRINLTWADVAGVAGSGYYVERAIAAGGPWMQINTLASGATTYSDTGLYPASTWHYRVRAYNAGGNSAYSGVASATTSNPPPVLAAVANRTIAENTTLSITNATTASDFVQLITDFENFTTDTTNGVPLFRDPRYSSSTSTNIDMTPDLSLVTDVYTTTGHGTGRVLRVCCNYTNTINPWLRLTTAGTPNWPSPVINLTKKLRFDLYTDKALKVGLGCRETTTAVGTAIGTNGGTTGGIEWVGVTNAFGGAPMPTRTVNAGAWTTLTFNLPTEPVVNFSGGNGILSTASGLGVLEHLAIVPAAGNGSNNLYLDNFAVVTPKTFTYALKAGAPTNATVNAATGVFAWTPTEAQGPGTYSISVIVTDNSAPPLSATNTFNVTVLETNSAPVLAAISSRTVHAGSLVTFTNSATDADLPANTLTYTLDPGAPAGASVTPATGIFQWLTADVNAGTSYPITERVTDNGSPAMSDAKPFTVTVLPRPGIQSPSLSNPDATLTWSAIAGTAYRVQFKDDLSATNWITLTPDVTATGPAASITNAPLVPQRFYRVLVLNQ
jgi:hypothetical protein